MCKQSLFTKKRLANPLLVRNMQFVNNVNNKNPKSFKVEFFSFWVCFYNFLTSKTTLESLWNYCLHCLQTHFWAVTP